MAHNTLVRAGLAAWGADATITAAELWAIDQACESAINGDDGGTWAPTDPIILGGSGLQVTGDFSATGASLFTDCQGLTLTVGSIDIEVGTSIEVAGDINVLSGGNVNVLSGGEIEVRSGGIVDLLAGSTSTLAGTMNVASGGTVSVQSGGALSTAAGSATALAGDATQLGRWTRSGTSARSVFRRTTATNVNTTPNVGYDIWEITINDGNPYTATCAVTGTVPVTGERLFIRKIGTSGILMVSSEGPIPICQFGPGTAGGAELYFDGTQWRLWSFWESAVHIFSGA